MSQETDLDPSTPTRCPYCASAAIVATGKKITTSSYWRCEGCGQVWNPGRLRQTWAYGRR
jgi:transposase-like protein